MCRVPSLRSRAGRRRKGPGLATSAERRGCRVSGRLWVEREGRTLLSWGRVVLLEQIREHGSISAAARSMGMGYRHAWELVEEMNRLSPRDLVARKTGGRGGGGTRLTSHGEAAVASFWELVEGFGEWLSHQDPRLWRAPGGRAKAGGGRRGK